MPIDTTPPTRTRRRRAFRARFLAALLAAALLPAPAPGQEEAPPPDPAVAAVREALRLAGDGDLDAAISTLETVREEEGGAPGFVLATLGALYVEAERPEPALELLAPLAEDEDADPAVLYNAGRAALAQGYVSDAVLYLQRSVALQPGTPAARELGLLHGAAGRYQDAYRLLRPWARAHPEDREARLGAALCAIQLRRLPEAEELLSGLPQNEPAAGLLWGRLLLLQGEPHAAIGVLQPLVAEAPGPVAGDLRSTLAEAHLQVGESEHAVSLLQGRTEGDPASSFLLAQALYQGGELEQALEVLQPFAEPVLGTGIDPENPNRSLAADVVRDYGRWLASAGRHDEALAYLRLAIRAEPEAKDAWQALAQALAATGAREEAQEALARFQELSRQEGSESAQVNRARLEREDPTAAEIQRARELLAQERPEEALEVLRAERDLSPDDPRPWLLESRVLLILERADEALAAAERAVALAPESPDPHYQRGTVHLARNDLAAAEADLRRALELAPAHVPALNDLAVLLLVQGERGEAVRLLERVLELRPDDPRAKETLERLEGG